MNEKQPVDWIAAQIKAASTGKMANTLAKALAKRYSKRWQFIDFLGPAGRESAGIVDIFAIRKSSNEPEIPGLKKLDLFDIWIMQVKGGSASDPKLQDISRMKLVQKHYHAKGVILFRWEKSNTEKTGFFLLNESDQWVRESPAQLFGSSPPARAGKKIAKTNRLDSSPSISTVGDGRSPAEKTRATRRKSQAAKATKSSTI